MARLIAAGHHALAPDLPGCGPETMEFAGRFGLADHIAAATGALDRLGHNVILVAHSYAGMLARALEHLRPAQMAHVCYVEALLPQPGEAALDLVPREARSVLLAGLRERPDGPVLLPPDVTRFAIPDPGMALSIAARLVPHPHRTFAEPLPLPRAHHAVARTYVFASDRNPNPYQRFIDEVRAEPTSRVAGWTGGHELMLTRAAELAALLLDIANRNRPIHN